MFFARCNGLFSECGTISDRHPIFYTDLGRNFSDLQIFYLSLFNQAFCVKAKFLGCKLSFYFYTVGARVFTTVDRNPLFNKVLQRTKVSIWRLISDNERCRAQGVTSLIIIKATFKHRKIRWPLSVHNGHKVHNVDIYFFLTQGTSTGPPRGHSVITAHLTWISVVKTIETSRASLIIK